MWPSSLEDAEAEGLVLGRESGVSADSCSSQGSPWGGELESLEFITPSSG